ncbi:hypothetical protein THIOM_002076 [Candidatus Thiomargarita nelsonii]|uniref:Uncharacterized protein n=1 Tax=Candidatus Thiomargarita nelsonii TaxID=1003181 RepID=A0A176S2H9_9GAMM|nr:hypothetical protein THIOM_002076 [Candidatus Thiomargarita nelsonii]
MTTNNIIGKSRILYLPYQDIKNNIKLIFLSRYFFFTLFKIEFQTLLELLNDLSNQFF